MNGEPFLPPKTREILNSPPIKGTRHHEMKDVALSMIGNSFPPDEVFGVLRKRYPADVTDTEISDVIGWVVDKNPQPSVPRNGVASVPMRNGFQPWVPKISVVTSEPEGCGTDPIFETKRFLRAPSARETAILKKSEPLPAWEEHFSHLLCCCYDLSERVNVVTRHGLREGKAFPNGTGTILTIEEWIERGVQGSEAGGWMRMNPVSDGVADENVTAYRFVLLENDVLSPDMQLDLLCRLSLPIAVLMWSGGVSYHAWVKVDCQSLDEYRNTSARLLKMLGKFGFDQANKNPSRLSRLPGVQRTIGAKQDGRQRLIYLNPNPSNHPIL